MKKFYVGIKGVIISNKQVLLLHTNAENGRGNRWEFPGGRIDGEETIEQALDRELHEELPNIESFQMHEMLHAHRLPEDIEGNVSLMLLFFRVTAVLPSEIVLSDEHIEAHWFNYEEALEKVEDGLKSSLHMLMGEVV